MHCPRSQWAASFKNITPHQTRNDTPYLTIISKLDVRKASLAVCGSQEISPASLTQHLQGQSTFNDGHNSSLSLHLPARSTALISPSRMPASQRQAPSSHHQNVDDGCHTILEIGSNLSSRSSPTVDGNSTLTALAPRRTGMLFARTSVETEKNRHTDSFPDVLVIFSYLTRFDVMI